MGNWFEEHICLLANLFVLLLFFLLILALLYYLGAFNMMF